MPTKRAIAVAVQSECGCGKLSVALQLRGYGSNNRNVTEFAASQARSNTWTLVQNAAEKPCDSSRRSWQLVHLAHPTSQVTIKKEPRNSNSNLRTHLSQACRVADGRGFLHDVADLYLPGASFDWNDIFIRVATQPCVDMPALSDPGCEGKVSHRVL